jgi:hypothetical protein
MASASEWKRAALRAAEAVELTLPSGVTIRARRPDPLQLAMGAAPVFSDKSGVGQGRRVGAHARGASGRDSRIYA